MKRKLLWLDRRALQILHAESLAEFGGGEGMRDEGLFDSALTRPVHLHLYESQTDIARLAAAYGFGLARNHPFVDGNKRVAFIAVGLFLKLNGWNLKTDPLKAHAMIIKVAEGTLTEDAFSIWLRNHMTRRPKS